jgi:hypothetical protein
MKTLLGALLLIAILFIPAKNIPQTEKDPADGDADVTIADSVELPDVIITYRDRMLMPADCSCDPAMMIWVTPDSDPGFMLEPGL